MRRRCRLNLKLQLVLLTIVINGAISAENTTDTKVEEVKDTSPSLQNSTENVVEEEAVKQESIRNPKRLEGFERVRYGSKDAYPPILLQVQSYNPYHDFQGYPVRSPNRHEFGYRQPFDDDFGNFELLDDTNGDYDYGGPSSVDNGDFTFSSNPDSGFDNNQDDDYGDWEVLELPQGYNIINGNVVYDDYETATGRQATVNKTKSGYFSCKYGDFMIYTNNKRNCDNLIKNKKIGVVEFLTRKEKDEKKKMLQQQQQQKKTTTTKAPSKKNKGGTSRQHVRRQQLRRQQFNNQNRRNQINMRRDYNRRIQNRKRVQYQRYRNVPKYQVGRLNSGNLYFLTNKKT